MIILNDCNRIDIHLGQGVSLAGFLANLQANSMLFFACEWYVLITSEINCVEYWHRLIFIRSQITFKTGR
jgi:hypothetical protein